MKSDILKRAWPEWQIEERLGKGSFGVVYKAVRKDRYAESHAAVKVISIPADTSEVDSLRYEGLDEQEAKTYLWGIVDDFASEIRMMEDLKDVPNIVRVEDYKIVEKENEIGWDIYIRMELLKPFHAYSFEKKLSEAEIIKIGCDICSALEICNRRNIIHRDIKPENIFVNKLGDFKLGDFGIARKLENKTGGLSQKGTFNYMAPEVISSTEYDTRADIYSLGIVLYRLLNGNRMPFLDTEAQHRSPHERQNALERRLHGEALPPPQDASAAMAEVVLRACAYSPDDRFLSAAEMKQALLRIETLSVATTDNADDTDEDKISDSLTRDVGTLTAFTGNGPPSTGQNDNDGTENTSSLREKKKNTLRIIAAVSLTVAAVVGFCAFAVSSLFHRIVSNAGQAPASIEASTISNTPAYRPAYTEYATRTDMPQQERTENVPSNTTPSMKPAVQKDTVKEDTKPQQNSPSSAKPVQTAGTRPTPSIRTTAKPTAKPIAKPTAKPTPKPTVKAAAEPAAKPVATPAPTANATQTPNIRWMPSTEPTATTSATVVAVPSKPAVTNPQGGLTVYDVRIEGVPYNVSVAAGGSTTYTIRYNESFRQLGGPVVVASGDGISASIAGTRYDASTMWYTATIYVTASPYSTGGAISYLQAGSPLSNTTTVIVGALGY